MRTIAFNELKKISEDSRYIIVDLRNSRDYNIGHVKNAINMPNASIIDIEKYGKKDLTWVLYCKRGSLSFRLASLMDDRGYKVIAVVGGFKS